MTPYFLKLHNEIILIQADMASLRVEINRATRSLTSSHELLVEHAVLQQVLNEKFTKFIDLTKSTNKLLSKDREKQKNITRKDIRDRNKDLFEIQMKKSQIDTIEKHIKQYSTPDFIILKEESNK